MKRALGADTLKDFSVNKNGQIEEISWSLYDFAAYAAAGQSSLSFFQNPIGQAGKTLSDTNMEAAGQIPRGQNFVVEAICVEFFSGATIDGTAANGYADDVKAFAENGSLDFVVGSKSYKKEAPLGIFPQQYRTVGFGATGVGTVNSQVAANSGAIHSIVPVRLTSNQNFSVTMNWPSVVALPSTNDGRIGVRLVGRLFRNSQ